MGPWRASTPWRPASSVAATAARGVPIESPFVFYPKYLGRTLRFYGAALQLLISLAVLRWHLKRDPDAKRCMDRALDPVTDDELEELEMFKGLQVGAGRV